MLNKYLTAALFFSAFGASGQTTYYTLDDIFQGKETITVHELLTANGNTGSLSGGMYNSYPDVDSRTTTFTRVNDYTVRIDNFRGTGVSFDFLLTDATHQTGTNLEGLYDGTILSRIYEPATSDKPQTLLPVNPAGVKSTGYLAYDWVNLDYCELEINRTADGIFYFSSPYVITNSSPYPTAWNYDSYGWAYRSSGNSYPADADIFHQVEYVALEANATGSHNRTTYYKQIGGNFYYGRYVSSIQKGRTQAQRFDVRIDIDNDAHTISILNFANYGLNYDFHELTADNRDYTRRTITGTFDDEGNVTFTPGQCALSLWSWVDNYGPAFRLPFRLMSVTGTIDVTNLLNEGKFSETLTGKLTINNSGLPRHNSAPHGFVTHGGKRRTFGTGYTLTIDQPFSFVHTDPYTFGYMNEYGGTDLITSTNGLIQMDLAWHHLFENATYSGIPDITLATEFVRTPDVQPTSVADDSPEAEGDGEGEGDLEPGEYAPLESFACTLTQKNSDGDYYVVPVFKTLRNEQHVESYEIVAVPGEKHDADQMNDALGTSIPLVDIVTGQEIQPVLPNADKIYRPGYIKLPVTKTQKKFTLAIKANYKPETQLTPTYHDLYTVGPETPTGIREVDATAVRVTAVNGEIVVSGFNGTVEVYNVQGAAVYKGTDTRIAVPGGIYIVRAGSKTAKVVIR